jgi:hypothetical protein
VKAITSKIAFGNRGIIHVQIEENGKMSFAAYDNFDRECVVAFPAVSFSTGVVLVFITQLNRLTRFEGLFSADVGLV